VLYKLAVKPDHVLAFLAAADLLGGHRRGPTEALAPGAGGVQAFADAFDDELAR
jgi:hypothetical protein